MTCTSAGPRFYASDDACRSSLKAFEVIYVLGGESNWAYSSTGLTDIKYTDRIAGADSRFRMRWRRPILCAVVNEMRETVVEWTFLISQSVGQGVSTRPSLSPRV